MKYLRVFSDSVGETHFEDLDTSFALVNYAPPAPPLLASAFNPALQYGFIRIPAGWYGDWHPVAGRQMHFYLSGEVEAQVSDGEIRHAIPGTVALVEDTTGKGHVSRAIGADDVLIAVVLLPE
jgi:hypothetical protein